MLEDLRVDMGGRVCLVTGANTGIGRVTARELARWGARVYLTCRSVDKGRSAVDEIRETTGNRHVFFLPLDLSRLGSVRECARLFVEVGSPLDVLINNAGLAGQRGRTADGFELAFGVNHLGHFLLTNLLLERLEAATAARVVTVASKAHYDAVGIDFAAVRRKTSTISGLREYGVSKLANVLFSAELARRLAGTAVSTYALHPGVIASDIWRRVPWPVRPFVTRKMLTTEEGARTTLYCATSPAVAAESGLYYHNCARREPSAPARDEALAAQLWSRSAQWCGLT